MNNRKEFSLGRTGQDCWLNLGLVRDGATAEHKNQTSDGMPSKEVRGMSSIDVARKKCRKFRSSEGGESRIGSKRLESIGG